MDPNPIRDQALSRAKVLTLEQELERARAGDRHALVLANLRLAFKLAREHAVYGVSQEELYNEGVLGLCEAAARFDPARGVRFSGYAHWYIRAWIWRYIQKNRRSVRFASSRAGRKLVIEMRKAQHRLRGALCDEPTAAQVARELAVKAEDVQHMELGLAGRDLEFEDDRTPALAFQEHNVIELQTRELVHLAVDDMEKPGLQHVIRRRFFENDNDAVTLQVVANERGVTRERIRQMEQEALRALSQDPRIQWTQEMKTQHSPKYRPPVAPRVTRHSSAPKVCACGAAATTACEHLITGQSVIRPCGKPLCSRCVKVTDIDRCAEHARRD